jgi:hypothetical protein
MTKLQAGEELSDIRIYIDQTYAKYGPPTDTEMP